MNGRRDDIEADPLWDLVSLVGDVDLPKNPDGSEPSIDEVVYEWPSSAPAPGPARPSGSRATRDRNRNRP